MYRLHIWLNYSTKESLSSDTKVNNLVTSTVNFMLIVQFCRNHPLYLAISCHIQPDWNPPDTFSDINHLIEATPCFTRLMIEKLNILKCISVVYIDVELLHVL